MNRRGFFGVLGGAALAPILPWQAPASIAPPTAAISEGTLVAQAWEAHVASTVADNIFDRYWLLEKLHDAD